MMHDQCDVLVIGGGIAGLMSAMKLSKLGMKVILVERENELASGPSTRNEGWLHRGTYHAGSIVDRAAAIQVAQRCIYGHEQIRRNFPEAVENLNANPHVLVRDKERLDELESRWSEAGVGFKRLTLAQAKQHHPDANIDRASAAFEVHDVSVNTRLLYRRIKAEAEFCGTKIICGATLISATGEYGTISLPNGDTQNVRASVFLYAAGYGIRALISQTLEMQLPLRYWKSHLVITRRLSERGLFYADPNEAAMMHHGKFSIVGMNEDAVLSEKADYEVIPERKENIRHAIKRMFPSWDDQNHKVIACVKTDVSSDTAGARSLNIAIQEPVFGHICVLPGKMTEAPFLTDILVQRIHARINDDQIALRPCDQIETNSNAGDLYVA